MKNLVTTLGLLAACAAPASLWADAGSEPQFIGSLNVGGQAIIKSVKDAKFSSGEGVSAVSYRNLNPESSWEEINKWLLPEFPQISFGSWLISVENLCVDGTNLRPRKPTVQECVEWGRRGDGWECVRTTPKYLSTPIEYERDECVRWGGRSGDNWGCLEYARRRGKHALSYQIPVKPGPPHTGDREPRVLFTKGYDIANCN